MHGRRLVFTWLITLLALDAGAIASGPELDLRYRFDKGETAFSRLEIETQTTTEIDRQSDERRRGVIHTLVLESHIEDVDAERGSTILYTIRALQSQITDDSSKPVIRDSHAPRPTEEDLQLRELVGSTFTITLDPTGALSSATGLDALGRAMTSHLAGDGVEGQLAGALVRALTEDSLSEALAGGLRVLPDHPVARGDTWTTNFDQPLPFLGSASSTWRHRLARIRKQGDSMLATIESELDMSLNTQPGALDGLIQLDPDRIKGTSTLTFDATRGQAISAKAELTLPVVVTMPNLDTLETERLEQIIHTRMAHELINERDVPALPK